MITYKLPHPLDREFQQQVMDWILNSDKKWNILCAPTGFGKSPLAAAASIDFRTLVLVLHKSLQSANYRDVYNFDILYGKSNYPCLEHNKKSNQSTFLSQLQWTAYDCSNPHCGCPYQQQELGCLLSDRVSFNYAKYLMSGSFTERFQPAIIFCDEAHNLPGIIMNYVGLTLRWDNEFINFKCRPELERLQYQEAMHYLRSIYKAIITSKPDREKNLSKWRKWKRLSQKVIMVGQLIGKQEPEDWYFEVDKEQLLIRPLTAKYHFKSMFGKSDKVVLMSATITPNIAERLGLEENEWDYYEVPAIWPVPTRLVYDLDGPAMNWQSSETDKQEQAKLIASVLRPNCSGVIHVMSKAQAYELSKRLYDITLDWSLRFHTPTDGTGTDEQYQEWQEMRQPGIYCISWSFHEGVDLGLDKITIMAKTPFASMKPGYEQARIEYDPQWNNEQTAYRMEQIFGRHQRGLPEHYVSGAKLSYIADSSWHRIKTNLSPDFRMRIRKWRGNINQNYLMKLVK